MTQSIKLTTDQMRLMSLFGNITKTAARDCIEDEKQDKVTFVVEHGKMGLAIGKGGSRVKLLRNKIKRHVDLVEFDPDPAKFVANMLNPKYVLDVRIEDRPDGSRQAVVSPDPLKRGLVMGREGCNIERARMLAKRYFNITHVSVASQERPTLEM